MIYSDLMIFTLGGFNNNENDLVYNILVQIIIEN